MEYVGGQGIYNEYFCDECNKYYYEDPQDRIQGEEVWESMNNDDKISPLLEWYNVDEDIYGVEDGFFTRDDLIEFEGELEDQLLKDELPNVNVYRAFMEPGNNLEVDWEYFGYEETSKAKIDMRKIRKPNDLLRYIKPIEDDILAKVSEFDVDMGFDRFEDDLDFEESVNESYSVIDLDTGDKFGRFDDINRAWTKALQYMKMFNIPNTVIVDTNTNEPLYRVRPTGKLEWINESVNEDRKIGNIEYDEAEKLFDSPIGTKITMDVHNTGDYVGEYERTEDG